MVVVHLGMVVGGLGQGCVVAVFGVGLGLGLGFGPGLVPFGLGLAHC